MLVVGHADIDWCSLLIFLNVCIGCSYFVCCQSAFWGGLDVYVPCSVRIEVAAVVVVVALKCTISLPTLLLFPRLC